MKNNTINQLTNGIVFGTGISLLSIATYEIGKKLSIRHFSIKALADKFCLTSQQATELYRFLKWRKRSKACPPAHIIYLDGMYKPTDGKRINWWTSPNMCEIISGTSSDNFRSCKIEQFNPSNDNTARFTGKYAVVDTQNDRLYIMQTGKDITSDSIILIESSVSHLINAIA